MARVLVLLSLGLFLIPGCVSSERYDSASQEIVNQDDVIRMLRESNVRLEEELTVVRNDRDLMKVELERLRGQAAGSQDLNALRAELASLRARFSNIDDAIQVRDTPEGPALSVEGSVLFRPGQDVISDRGRDLLRRIAERLQGSRVRVEGHTDSMPVRVQAKRYPMGNLQLAASRALNVAWFLVTECGLPHDDVAVAGYGAGRPVATNDDDGGRQQNRRVEIVVLR